VLSRRSARRCLDRAGGASPLGGDIVLAVMGIPLDNEASFDKIRERQAQLRSGDEMTFKVLRAGRVIELGGRVP
jgi:S1-C subfamily serine protease